MDEKIQGRRLTVNLIDDVPTYKINISDIKSKRFDLIVRHCPVCGVKLSSQYPYHPEDDCAHGIVYNVDAV